MALAPGEGQTNEEKVKPACADQRETKERVTIKPTNGKECAGSKPPVSKQNVSQLTAHALPKIRPKKTDTGLAKHIYLSIYLSLQSSDIRQYMSLHVDRKSACRERV